ncbi:hypothetical protein A2933_00375 [Candidatus Nomurabacteria bacterium RIFCSPLOWO2_01_FULL_46_18]|uniref:DUF5666 domain-containing protein n=1 Tax=Candidatus Nomurabacteria bacterium RIFCSPLOWO2_01_FULL_46_18 TaxID=1801783 RepID=A0A1F6XE68_9BACT|nr:MAG: hypothetical protein A2933_00375 [Candidatus Nomurabacteria bacterium RIFCSPLOWO2_01_FULL_46_18]
MKNIIKKYWVFGLVLTGVVLGLGALGALAHTGPSSNSGPGSAGPVILNIGPNGNTLLRGVIKSVGTDSLVVTSWGGDWNIKVVATTQILSPNRSLTDFQVGNFAGVLGMTSQDGDFVVDARIVRSWGPRSDGDSDGISDDQDSDDDNDGVDDSRDQRGRDHDDDGIIDALDPDDDNDGILDVNERGRGQRDHDNDGIADGRDDDDDNDDLDDDEDLRDDDHDNDGISDKDDDDDDDDDDEEEDDSDDNSGSNSGTN